MTVANLAGIDPENHENLMLISLSQAATGMLKLNGISRLESTED